MKVKLNTESILYFLVIVLCVIAIFIVAFYESQFATARVVYQAF